MTFFEPSPTLLAFIFIQRFVFFEVLGLLALMRTIVGRGWARFPAGIALLICAAAIATSFAPAFDLQGMPLYADAARLLAHGGGTTLPLITSGIFALCLLMPSRRWRWIDIAHCAGMMGFLSLWVMTRA